MAVAVLAGLITEHGREVLDGFSLDRRWPRPPEPEARGCWEHYLAFCLPTFSVDCCQLNTCKQRPRLVGPAKVHQSCDLNHAKQRIWACLPSMMELTTDRAIQPIASTNVEY